MGKSRAKWDVWFVAADQVYRGVPTDVVAGWASQGRLAAGDRLRPAGTAEAWRRAADVPGVGGFLSAPPPAAGWADDAAAADLDVGPPPRAKAAEDDEVDMIPLIDISLVLLVFFMMTTAVAALPPIPVPGMKHASELAAGAAALTVQVEKRAAPPHVYSVRVGAKPAAAGDAELATPAELFARLDALLSSAALPPEVRIACEGDVPSDVVWALTAELDRRQKSGRISKYTADVQEKK